MKALFCLPALLAAGVLFAAGASADDTPNLKPGLWLHSNTTTLQGPISLPPQTHSNQECFTKEDLHKGVDVLNIPEECTLTRADIQRDRVDYAASCNMQGMITTFNGHATFHGDRMQGQMGSNMDTPMGSMTMQIDYQAERIGDC